MIANPGGMPLQKILLVDDDKSFRYLNRAMLKYSDVTCQIDECNNGKDALAYIANAQQAPDLILLDINMPVMDGLEFLEEFDQLGGRQAQPKVFMLTSSDDERDKKQSLKYKFVKGYFEKPLTEEHIQQMLATF